MTLFVEFLTALSGLRFPGSASSDSTNVPPSRDVFPWESLPLPPFEQPLIPASPTTATSRQRAERRAMVTSKDGTDVRQIRPQSGAAHRQPGQGSGDVVVRCAEAPCIH